MHDSDLDLLYKCGSCAYKFPRSMRLRQDEQDFCPHCEAEIIAFSSEAEEGEYEYVVHTRDDRYLSVVRNKDDGC
ncbi:MAG TPA: hypothetical protein VNN62_23015 [Methylomirabilota bacterium]|jgi:DNA-directed RNA polymerase subunit RPC12/RpoP|nr:hypothetical protein [Methylomirabilota bacterium]